MTINLTTDRIKIALYELGNPHLTYPVFHVAGTNGKGSVVNMLSHILQVANLRVGKFTSPHLLSPNDCISINNLPVDENDFSEYQSGIAQAITVELTLFELLTCTAFLFFQKYHVDVAVVEVGMGGLTDATNVFTAQNKIMTIITSLGIDHQSYLGSSIEEIARQKCGTILPCVPVLLSNQRPEYQDAVDSTVAEICQDLGSVYFKCEEYLSEQSHVLLDEISEMNNIRHVRGHNFYQSIRTIIAIILLCREQRVTYSVECGMKVFNALKSLSICQVICSLADLRILGRMDKIVASQRTCVIDGAHNLEAIKNLRNQLDYWNMKPITFIMAFSNGKPVDDMLRNLINPGDTLFIVEFTNPRGMPWVRNVCAKNIQEIAGNLGIPTHIYRSLSTALQEAKGDIVICGSLYLVSDFYRLDDTIRKLI